MDLPFFVLSFVIRKFYPDSYRTLFAKGSVLARAGRNDEAIEAMEKALDLAPDRIKVRIQNQIDQLEAGESD